MVLLSVRGGNTKPYFMVVAQRTNGCRTSYSAFVPDLVMHW